ncbi:MAG: hypothetical protein A07HR60_01259 [uncultured archaeon A07HR60]|nr:MAG: hypothetical protein A07HR60_01259 [uncultured archaeon A07HR60]
MLLFLFLFLSLFISVLLHPLLVTDASACALVLADLQWFKTKANGFSRGMKPTTENHTRYSCTLLSVPFKEKKSVYEDRHAMCCCGEPVHAQDGDERV